MNERPDPSPEGRAIAEALRRTRPKMSQRQAARLAGISETRWRQIVSGYQMVGGRPIPVEAPAETVARMAQVVGVTAERLTEAGREDAAAELRELGALVLTEPEPTITEMAARVAETNARVSAMAAKIEALQRQLDDERAERRREAG